MKLAYLVLLSLSLVGCQGGNDAGSGSSPGGETHVAADSGRLEGWQTSLLGQEGHGGDAIVCFSIPVDQALYQANAGSNDDCQQNAPCMGHSSPTGEVWRMTDTGRRSIVSAQPLEQYLAARTEGGKHTLDRFNQMSVEDGYREAIQPFSTLPAAASRIHEMHRKLGWLLQDGVASEYGLMQVNDSGFLNETEIDREHCKELQAVVRRDNQLWYDADIVHHFDKAGLVAIQLHEEIYTWGKKEDEFNLNVYDVSPHSPVHLTSTNARRLILKLLSEKMDSQLLNDNLKALGFSVLYWSDSFHVPTSIGYYMDSDTCIGEQRELRNLVSVTGGYWNPIHEKLFQRYLKREGGVLTGGLQFNLPDALSDIISFVSSFNGAEEEFREEITQLLEKFEKPEACVGQIAG